MPVFIYPNILRQNMEVKTVCGVCDSADLSSEVMFLAMGQEGVAPKEIVVVKCNDCGKQHQLSS